MNICIGVSSACQTGHESHILEALQIKNDNRDKIIRISMSDYNTYSEVKYLVKNIIKLLDKHRKIPENKMIDVNI
jgi:cysteine sulfinate desulfinase/cysteine desulfurase-like protein